MPKDQFDAAAFYAALDAERTSKQKNWKEVAAASKVSASTLTRLAQGRRPDVDSLAALCRWSGLRADDYMNEGQTRRRPASALAVISTHLRADPHLDAKGAAMLEELIKTAYERLRK